MIFRPWSQSLEAEGIEVKAVMLPGRLARAKEPVVLDMAAVVENVYLSLQVQGFLDDGVPLIFFGHSLGGLIAYELTKFIERELGTAVVAHLLVSGTNSPWDHHIRYTAPSYKCKHTLNNEDLLAEIMKLGGMDGVAPELIRMALPVMRADFTVLETYRIQGAQQYEEGMDVDDCCAATANSLLKVVCPMTVIGGGQDSLVDIPSLHRWRFFSFGGDCGVERFECDVMCKPTTARHQPFYNTFVDEGGSHFYFMDKIGGGEEWFFSILSSLCKNPSLSASSSSRRDRLEDASIIAPPAPPAIDAPVILPPAVVVRV